MGFYASSHVEARASSGRGGDRQSLSHGRGDVDVEMHRGIAVIAGVSRVSRVSRGVTKVGNVL